MTIAYGINYAAHLPERKAGFDRLRAALQGEDVFVEDQPGRWWEWSERLWRGTREAFPDATHYCFLYEDYIPCNGFAKLLPDVVAAQPTSMLCLYCIHAMAAVADQRKLRWVTSRDGIIGGAGNVLPASMLDEFLAWRRDDLRELSITRLTEDQQLNVFAMTTGRYVWHTVPALVDHDHSIPTNYPDNAVHSAKVPFRDPMPTDWNTDAVHIGRVYRGNHWALLTEVKPKSWPKYRIVERAFELNGDVSPMGDGK